MDWQRPSRSPVCVRSSSAVGHAPLSIAHGVTGEEAAIVDIAVTNVNLMSLDTGHCTMRIPHHTRAILHAANSTATLRT